MKNLFTSFKDNCGFGLLASLENKPTHKNLQDAIKSLSRMMHRGAIAADGKSGDGSGLWVLLLASFYFIGQKGGTKKGVVLLSLKAVMAGKPMVPLTKDWKKIFGTGLERYWWLVLGFIFLFGKGKVPFDTNALGEYALERLPNITQIFVTPNSIMSYKRFEAMLYLTRKEIEHALKD